MDRVLAGPFVGSAIGALMYERHDRSEPWNGRWRTEMNGGAQHRLRRFELVRYEDESVTSGTGIVAVGVEFPSGYVEMEWLNDRNPNLDTAANGHAAYPGGIEDVRRVHGHGGRTEVRWID